MYETYFDFTRRPFSSIPRADDYFPGTAIDTARQTLARCIEGGEGAGMVVGPPGTGKTLLCQVLAEQIKESFPVALLSSGRLSTRRALFQAILYELGQSYRGMDEGELRLALVDYLTSHEECPRGMALLVDEAHTLPLRLLEEIRMLTNIARDGQPGVHLVLAGGSALEERLANPKLDSFSQRLVGRCYLESFNRSETEEYIQTRIDSCGGTGEAVFSTEACQAVFRATDGVPRLINQVCNHALLLACTADRLHLEPADIEEAWADLQQLPTPWNEESQAGDGGPSVIEFGGLDDETGEADQLADKGPQLRISPETGEIAPDEQLERIEELLDNVEEEFQPAGSIGPEIELVFDEPALPFKEKFQEEEVVADRYAAADEAHGDLVGQSDEEEAVEQEVDRETVFPLKESAEVAEADDSELIVVEDDYYDDLPEECPVVPVRRHQYARLFAKLRHG